MKEISESASRSGRSMRLGYSYIRFSTPEQRWGKSERRQVEGVEKLFRNEGIRMAADHVFDRGLSAFRGAHAKRGALAVFLEKVRAGEIPEGSVLAVELLNRLSRQEPFESLALFRDIIKAGIEIWTLHDGMRYNRTNMREVGNLILVVMHFAAAHKESFDKAQWITDTWALKRKDAASGRPMTRQAPAWLKIEGIRTTAGKHDWSEAEFLPIPERVEIVKQVFEWRAERWGRRKIASELNAREIPVWGRGKRKAKGGWQESYIHKLLTSRAVLGEYQPHRLTNGRGSPRAAVGDPIPDYFPRVIEDQLWQAAQAYNEEARARPDKGRPSTVLLTGMLVDPDESPMHVERKGDGCDYYATSRAFRRPGKPTWRWRIDHLDACVLQLVRGIDWQRVLTDESRTPELKRLRGKFSEVSRQETALRAKIDHAAKALLANLGAFGEAIQAQAAQLNAELSKLISQRTEINDALREIERSAAAAADSGGIAKQLTVELTPDKRARLRAQLHALVKRIQVWPDGHTPDRYWKHAVAEATKVLTGNRGLSARASGKVAGAVRFEFVGGKKITAYVTYRPAARADRDPRVIGFANPVGMALDDWLDIAAHVKWGLWDLGNAKIESD